MSQMVGEIVSYDRQITQRTLEQLPSHWPILNGIRESQEMSNIRDRQCDERLLFTRSTWVTCCHCCPPFCYLLGPVKMVYFGMSQTEKAKLIRVPTDLLLSDFNVSMLLRCSLSCTWFSAYCSPSEVVKRRMGSPCLLSLHDTVPSSTLRGQV